MYFSSLVGTLAAIAVTGLQSVAAAPQPEQMTLWDGSQFRNVTLATRESHLSPWTAEEDDTMWSNSTDSGGLESRGVRFDKQDGERLDCRGSFFCYRHSMTEACRKASAFIQHYTIYRAGYVTFLSK